MLWTCPLIKPRPHPKLLWLEWQLANYRLRRGLVHLWNTVSTAAHLLRRCPRCGHVVPVEAEQQETCPNCKKRWFPSFTYPMAENARPLTEAELGDGAGDPARPLVGARKMDVVMLRSGYGGAGELRRRDGRRRRCRRLGEGWRRRRRGRLEDRRGAELGEQGGARSGGPLGPCVVRGHEGDHHRRRGHLHPFHTANRREAGDRGHRRNGLRAGQQRQKEAPAEAPAAVRFRGVPPLRDLRKILPGQAEPGPDGGLGDAQRPGDLAQLHLLKLEEDEDLTPLRQELLEHPVEDRPVLLQNQPQLRIKIPGVEGVEVLGEAELLPAVAGKLAIMGEEVGRDAREPRAQGGAAGVVGVTRGPGDEDDLGGKLLLVRRRDALALEVPEQGWALALEVLGEGQPWVVRARRGHPARNYA